jgi:hypothetical protein
MDVTSNGPAPIRSSSSSGMSGDAADGVEWAARFGYAAKGVVYAVIGGLAVKRALGDGGDTSSSREALEQIGSGPFGTAALGVVTLGLAAYTVWRLVQALIDPEGDRTDDGDAKRWAKRAFYLGSAAVYGLLTYFGATLVLGGGDGGSGGGGSSQGSEAGWTADLMSMSWGAWLVGIVGAGLVARGVVQLVKAYTKSFKDRIASMDLGPGLDLWIVRIGRFALTARGVVFGIIGASVIHAAMTHDPEQARGLSGALESLVTRPWLLAVVGLGLVAYGIYQWVKARYRIIGV